MELEDKKGPGPKLNLTIGIWTKSGILVDDVEVVEVVEVVVVVVEVVVVDDPA